MESANEDLKSTHDELVQGQKKMKTMMHELLAYVKSSWIVRGNLSRLEGPKKKKKFPSYNLMMTIWEW
jgi:hypothetical protein